MTEPFTVPEKIGALEAEWRMLRQRVLDDSKRIQRIRARLVELKSPFQVGDVLLHRAMKSTWKVTSVSLGYQDKPVIHIRPIDEEGRETGRSVKIPDSKVSGYAVVRRAP